MSFCKSGRVALMGILVWLCLFQTAAASDVATGPVTRKWGLGWDEGLTARLWLGGVWELSVAAGPDDFLRDSAKQEYDTGYPPNWNERREADISEDRTESGFVRVQGGRLVSRRGPLAVVCFTGLQYRWVDGRETFDRTDAIEPEDSYVFAEDADTSDWSLSLGLRPSFEVLDFLTLEMSFGLVYRWTNTEKSSRWDYDETGRVIISNETTDIHSFDYFGWRGMYSLQFFVWF